MAREFAQIKLSIWGDDDWRDLSPLARYLYLSLLTSPTLKHCGVADWRPARIAAMNGMTIDQLEEYGAELINALYLVVDEESEEVLIRSFVRNDGLMKQPKMAVAMASAVDATSSKVLRGVMVYELKRLRDDFPEMPGWRSEAALALLGKRSIDPSSYPLGKGSVKGSGKGKGTPIGSGSIKGSPTPTTATTTNNLTTSAIADAKADEQRSDAQRLCEHLADRIEANGVKRPQVTRRWLDSARLLIDNDGYTEQQVQWLIDRATQDDFWRANILSMPTLRTKADQLKLKFAPQSVPAVTDLRYFDDGSLDETSLPPVEDSWMKRRPAK